MKGGGAVMLAAALLVGWAEGMAAQETTAREVVEACAQAMGGRERIDGLRTLRLRYTLPDHGGQSTVEIRRPDLIRLGDVVVFDGERAAFLDRGPAPDGTPRPPELVDEEEWKDFWLDIGRYFPAFFDYPSEYLGVEYVEGIETHVLGVALPQGGHITYYVDASNSLPLMAEWRMTMYGRNYRGGRMFGAYREVDGILYPHEFTYYSPHVRRMLTVRMDQVEVNPDLPEGRFALPGELGR